MWALLPAEWQAGVYQAIDGKVFRGELPVMPGGNSRPLSVFICPKEVGDLIEKFLAYAASKQEG
jgi:hypothetical protein